MNLDLKNKVVLVAAGTRGIGFATAKMMAAEGARVSVCGVTPESLATAAKELGSKNRVYHCDLGKREDIQNWIESTRRDLGDPLIVVTNTGGPPAGSSLTVTDAQWQLGFANTLLSLTRMVEMTAPAMKAAKFGRFIHVTSLVAKDPNPLLAISSTLRAGIGSLSRLQAVELGPFGITVNCVLPGHTDTDRQTHLLEIRAKKNGTTVDQERSLQQEKIPLQRMARPDEIASVIAFLSSPGAAYVSGAQIVVDGAVSHGLG